MQHPVVVLAEGPEPGVVQVGDALAVQPETAGVGISPAGAGLAVAALRCEDLRHVPLLVPPRAEARILRRELVGPGMPDGLAVLSPVRAAVPSGPIGMIPPVELEDTYHHNQTAPAPAEVALASL